MVSSGAGSDTGLLHWLHACVCMCIWSHPSYVPFHMRVSVPPGSPCPLYPAVQVAEMTRPKLRSEELSQGQPPCVFRQASVVNGDLPEAPQSGKVSLTPPHPAQPGAPPGT